MNILIKNGTIVNSDKSIEADILLANGKIQNIGNDLSLNDFKGRIIDATGFYIYPGGIDPHVHMHLPSPSGFSSDDFQTGGKAALYGGTTTLIDFVTPNRGESLIEALNLRKDEAKNSLTDTFFHVSPVEWRSTTHSEIRELIQKHGIQSFKTYMAYKNSVGLDDADLFEVMKAVAHEGGVVTVHCELGDEIEILREEFAKTDLPVPEAHLLSRPPEMESEAVKKAIDLARKANCPLYIVHVSSAQSLVHIAKAQKEGQIVYAETCPQYLLLDQSKYSCPFDEAAAFVISPPLRTKEDNDALWKAIADGNVQTVGTDHCPFTLVQKSVGKEDFRKIPNGAGGVEHRMSLLYYYGVLQNRISLNKFVDITSTNAAKIFGLFPKKGIIAEGADADIVIWNPTKENIISVETHHQNCDLDIYEGLEIVGAPEFVILNGNIFVGERILSS
ncbi:MAG: dihydropyrimidinase [Bacteroidales bacterium]|nr:dihydropyrimidinase [Bacteroidales bacterium]MCF8454388.1 dihydropyrimidinase [Bacteroidales bacterium]